MRNQKFCSVCGKPGDEETMVVYQSGKHIHEDCWGTEAKITFGKAVMYLLKGESYSLESLMAL